MRLQMRRIRRINILSFTASLVLDYNHQLITNVLVQKIMKAKTTYSLKAPRKQSQNFWSVCIAAV